MGICDVSRRDLVGLTIILVLYILQGIPLGLSKLVPFVLQDKGIGYSDQARVRKIGQNYGKMFNKNKIF